MAFLSNVTRSEGDPKVLQSGPSSMTGSDRVARNLGWFSLGLGAVELLAPGVIARSLGLYGRESRLRFFGLREVLAGVLTLSVDKQAGLWSRVAGDALDVMTVLPAALNSRNPKRGNAALALVGLVGVTLLDAAAAKASSAAHARGNGPRRSYRDRSGFPKGLAAARSLALEKNADRVAPSVH